jgi:hypothetical protein
MTNAQARCRAEEITCFVPIIRAHCIPEATENFDIRFLVYSTPFWNRFVTNEALGIARLLSLMTRIIIATHTAVTKTFISPVNLCFFFAA